MLRLDIVDPSTTPAWDDFVTSQADATVFHTGAWATVLRDAYGYRPLYHVLRDEAGQICGGLPLFLVRSRLTGRRLVGLPFSDYGSPLVTCEADAELLLAGAKESMRAERASYMEVRGASNGGLEGLGLEAWSYFAQHRVEIDGSVEEMFSRLDSAARRAIRKARRADVAVREGTNRADLDAFCALNVRTRKKHGVPPQPRHFFDAIYKHFIKPGRAFVLLAEYEGQVIGADLFLRFGQTLYYKFNASDERFLSVRPNNVLMWRAIEVAVESGAQTLDLGRCELENEGLRRFKKLWGGREEPLPYYFYPSIQGVTNSSQSGIKSLAMKAMVRVLPPAMLSRISTLLYPHLA